MSATVKALESEATDKPLEVPFRDEVYVIPAPLDWPYDTLDLLADGKVSKAVDGLLGDQVEKFRKTGPKVRDAVALMEAIAGASGGELGN